MSSALDTLLAAARYIELQEQQLSSSSPPSIRNLGRYHNQNFNNSTNINNNNNNNNNTANNVRNNIRHQQVSISPVYGGLSNNIPTAAVAPNNHEYGSTSTLSSSSSSSSSGDIVRANHTDGRNKEPYSDGHSLPSSSFFVISTSSPTKQQQEQLQQQQQQKQQHNLHHHKFNIINSNNNHNNTNNNNNDNRDPCHFDDDDDQIMAEEKTKKLTKKNQLSEYRLPYTSLASSSNYKFYSSQNNNNSNNVLHKKFIPLTPPPISNNRKIEVTRTRSLSFSSNKITANHGNNSNHTTTSSSSSSSTTTLAAIGATAASSAVNNGNTAAHNMLATVTEDSSQSSLNLSSSGYLSGSSVNSNSGSCASSSNLNLNHSTGVNNNSINSDHQNVSPMQTQQTTSAAAASAVVAAAAAAAAATTTTTGRRRTTSTNSNGGAQRSPCILRAGTREVHNKLEKHRRAHLKECFEQLKIQLQLKDEEKKKPSNLAILGAAYRHVMSLRRRERELEQQVEQLAKEKINAQKRILTLKRELSVKYDNIDFSNIISDGDVGNIPIDRESLSDTASLSSGRGSIRYSSSSSLSSVNTVSSPVGSSIQSSVPPTLSPVISSSSSIPPTTTSPCSPLLKSSSSPISNNVIPLSLTTKNHHTSPSSSSSLQMESPIPSTPSPSPSSSSGISCSPVTSSASPPMMITNNSLSSSLSSADNLKLPNVPNGVKISHHHHLQHHHHPIVSSHQSNMTIVAATTAVASSSLSTPIINISTNENTCLTSSSLFTANNNTGVGSFGGILQQSPSSYGFTPQNVQISSTPKDLNGKNGVCNRKTTLSESSREPFNSQSIGSGSIAGGLVSINSAANIGCAKEIKVEKVFDESEQPTKVIKLFNGIALAPVDKDNKLLSSTPLALSQVVGGGGLVVSPFPMLTTPSQGLRVIGAANGLATIELSSPATATGVQTTHNNRNQHLQQSVTAPSVTTVTSTSAGAQLHKLLVSAGTQSQVNHHSTVSSSMTHTATVTPELARLPGGAELNILPAGANGSTLYRGNGKLAIVNNGITLKGTESSGTAGRAVHVVTPLQSGGAPISGLTPIVVSQHGPQGNNLAQLIASSPQLAGKVNLSVGGQTLPLISTQYLSSMKPMVVAVASNPSSLSSTSTSIATGTTITEHGSSS